MTIGATRSIGRSDEIPSPRGRGGDPRPPGRGRVRCCGLRSIARLSAVAPGRSPSGGLPVRPARALAVVLALALGTGLAACGKKPETLDPPEREDPIPYPRSYPST